MELGVSRSGQRPRIDAAAGLVRPAVEPAQTVAVPPAADSFRAAPAPPSARLPAGPQPALPRPLSAASLPWSADQQRPPRDLVLPWDLRSTAAREDRLLRLTEGRGALFAVGEWRPGAKPLVLVHGINADFADLQPIVDRFRNDPERQILVYAYDDQGRYTDDNGVDLARELSRFRSRYPWSGQLDIVAHSMGGILTRRALNELTSGKDPGAIDAFDRVRVVVVDTPWHGFPGPGLRMPFLKGAMDMQARSEMFRGDSRGNSAAARAGLYGVALPGHVEVDLVSADNQAAGQKPDKILDWSDIAGLRGALLERLRSGRPPKDLQAQHYLRAIMQDKDWPAAERELRRLDARGLLDDAAVTRVLERVAPRFAGGHSDVLGRAELLRHIEQTLR
jgi:pimeloyl-ACP methyl ester carboxylesterase